VRHPGKVRDKHICIFDDVITTGATVNSLAGVLKKAGAGSVTALALVRPREYIHNP